MTLRMFIKYFLLTKNKPSIKHNEMPLTGEVMVAP